MSLRNRLRRLEAVGERRDQARWPLACVCYRRGEPGDGGPIEARAPGVYAGGREIVFDTADERDRLLAPFLNPPPGCGVPLVLGFGPGAVEPGESS